MKRLAVLPLLLAAVGLAGCGSEDISPEEIASAAGTTADAGGSRVEFDMRMEAAGQTFDITGRGVMDMGTQRGRIVYELPGGQGEMEQIADGFVYYMRMEDLTGELPDGKSWIKIDQAKASKAMGVDLTQFNQTGAMNQGQMLEYLRTVGDVKKEGTEDVRGVETTRYSVVADIRKYPDAVPEGERERAERSVEALLDYMPDPTIPMDVWIDDEGLVRRMSFAIAMDMLGQEVSMDMDMQLYDFGTEVDVEIPPDDEVADMTDVAAKGAEQLRSE